MSLALLHSQEAYLNKFRNKFKVVVTLFPLKSKLEPFLNQLMKSHLKIALTKVNLKSMEMKMIVLSLQIAL